MTRPTPDPESRPRASVVRSILDGWSRVLHAPWVAGGVLLALMVVAMPWPTAIAVLTRDTAPSTNVFNAAFTDALLTRLDVTAEAARQLEQGSIASAASSGMLVYFTLWLFLAGGIVDRLARGRAVGAGPFFAACGVYFVRFLRLAAVAAPAYVLIARNLTSPGTIAFVGLVALTAVVNLVVDFAVVRTVVEDRRSMLSAIAASVRFIRRRPLRVLTLYLVNVAAIAMVVQLWAWATPLDPVMPWLGAGVFMLARVWARLALTASEIAFFQHELAHAHYTAAPPLAWPDSPAAEAIANLTRIARTADPGREGRRDA